MIYYLDNYPNLPELGPEFHTKYVNMCARLGLDPNYLASTIRIESGWKSTAENPVSHAVGFIQLMPKGVLKAWNMDPETIRNMSPIDQLDVVERYLAPWAKKGNIKTRADHYLVVFWPAAVGKPSDYVLADSTQLAYKQNHGLDFNQDGKITVSDIAAFVEKIPAVTKDRPPIPVDTDAVFPEPVKSSGGAASSVLSVMLIGLIFSAIGYVLAAKAVKKLV